MEFLTIHEVSRQFDISSRVARYRLHQLLQVGKLVEGPDYRRYDFVDDQHFVWRINPLGFMRETGFKPAAEPPAPPSPESGPVDKPDPSVTKVGNHGAPLVGNVDTQRPQADNQPQASVTKVAPALDTKPSPPGLEREMIDLLKSQMQTKDGQISELTDQNQNLSDTNLKLIGETVQQAKKSDSAPPDRRN
jgi:hypothetical protein